MSKRLTSAGYRVIKKEETDETDETDEKETETNISEDNTSDYESEGGGKYKYKSISQTNYKGKSKQAQFTKEQIKQKLVGYKPLKNSKERKELLELPLYKVWVRYINIETKEFRVGGLLKVVDPDLKYIMLVNTTKNITWSVQLNSNLIFIPDKQQKKEIEREKLKEDLQKEKLYKLWQEGKLRKK